MKYEQAFEIIERITRVDKQLNQLIDQFDNLDEQDRREMRKGVASVITELYIEVELPIYRQHPNLPNRRDK